MPKELPALGHTPILRLGLSGRNFGTTLETLSELGLEFPSRVRLRPPKPYNSRHLKPPELFQTCLPPVQLGTPLFSEAVPEGASQSCCHHDGIPSSAEGISEALDELMDVLQKPWVSF